jgi:hypothetical protein
MNPTCGWFPSSHQCVKLGCKFLQAARNLDSLIFNYDFSTGAVGQVITGAFDVSTD